MMTNQLLTNDHGRDCPKCQGWLEYAVTFNRADHAAADEVENSGPRKGQHFHTFADCQDCGEVFEVAK